jgi:beta-lactamase superfamily II metal-dependent hydrolase
MNREDTLSGYLYVFNVGQADSLLLSPVDKCTYENIPILIDCGQGSRNVFGYRGIEEKQIVLVLSHSHEDHIGGLSYLFNVRKAVLKELWLPFYSDEIAKISNFIFSLKGVSEVLGNTKEEYQLKGIIDTHRYLKEILKTVGCEKVLGVGRGDQLCEHISVYNPPVDPDLALGLPKGTAKAYFEEQRQNSFSDIRRWLAENEFKRIWASFISEGWDYSIPNLISDDRLSWQMRMEFIYGFLYKAKSSIDSFVESHKIGYFKKVAEAVKLSANDISVVFEYQSDQLSCLLTGDIGKKALKKCLKGRTEKPLQIFKFPHHGSKNSLDISVLNKLKPEVVVISHDNGKFGRQKDAHPNREVLEALLNMKVKVLCTNDVIKNGEVFLKKGDGAGRAIIEELVH